MTDAIIMSIVNNNCECVESGECTCNEYNCTCDCGCDECTQDYVTASVPSQCGCGGDCMCGSGCSH